MNFFLTFSVIVMLPILFLESMSIYIFIGKKMQITDYDMTWFIYIFDKEYVERMNNLNVHNPSTAVNPLAYVNDASSPASTKSGVLEMIGL